MQSRTKTIILAIFATIIVLLVGGFLFRDQLAQLFLRPTDSSLPQGVQRGDEQSIDTVTTDLETPWGMAFLPDGDLLVTERPGRLTRIADDNSSHPIEGVVETSEGGLLGIALHPEFDTNHYVYLYSTYRVGDALRNRVERYTFQDDTLTLDRTIIDDIPGSSNHDGGALAFGPDDLFYITTGDAGDPSSAQDTSSLSGKILRLQDDGSIPDSNPFDNPVYSYGHRNSQGLAWDGENRLWSTEHGPSGSTSGRDELNLIEAGANYGWPEITGDEQRDGMRPPIVQSGDNETWAPGGLAYVDGSLFFAGLRGQTLYQATIDQGDNNPSVSLRRHFSNAYGRLRAVASRDDHLYVSTSNTDGRGTPRPDDDRILQIDTSVFSDINE